MNLAKSSDGPKQVGRLEPSDYNRPTQTALGNAKESRCQRARINGSGGPAMFGGKLTWSG